MNGIKKLNKLLNITILYMWKFFLGLTSGIYIGTYYDCKPTIKKIEEFIKLNIPNKKDKQELFLFINFIFIKERFILFLVF